MSDNIPSDLLVRIFERLQMKQVGVCMVVCKTWYSAITSSYFINRNLNAVHTLSMNKTLEGFDDDLERYANKHVHEFCHPMKSLSECRIVGNVNGLICFSVELFPRDPILILWNPSVKKFLRVPRPNVTLLPYSFGFGFDDLSSDFKLVKMVDLKQNGDEVKDECMAPIEVFKLSTGKWSIMSHINTLYQVDGKSSHAFLNGNLHWAGYANEKPAIIVFNLHTEEFLEMALPNSSLSGKIDVYHGSLMLVNSYDQGVKMGIWIMETYGDESSWTRIYERRLMNGVLSLGPVHVDYQSLAMNRQISVSVNDDEQVMVSESCFPGENLVWRGLNRARFHSLQRGIPNVRVDIGLCGSENVASYMGAHFESLALLDHKGAAHLQTVAPVLEQSHHAAVGFDYNRKVKYLFGSVLRFIKCAGRRSRANE